MLAWQFECVIQGAPIGKGRPRATPMCSHGVCRVDVVAVFPRPKRLMRKKDPQHRVWHSSKPDIDNVCKSALDSMVMAGIIRDDTQVVILTAKSVYAAKDEGPCVELKLSAIDCDGPSE